MANRVRDVKVLLYDERYKLVLAHWVRRVQGCRLQHAPSALTLKLRRNVAFTPVIVPALGGLKVTLMMLFELGFVR